MLMYLSMTWMSSMWWPEAYDVEVDFDNAGLQAILNNPRGLVKLSQTKFGWILEMEAAARKRRRI